MPYENNPFKNPDAPRGKAARKLQRHHVYYACVLYSTGMQKFEILKEINALLEAEGIEPVSFEALNQRMRKFEETEGELYGRFVKGKLESMEQRDILDYLLGDLMMRYEKAKIEDNTSLVLSISTKIRDLISEIHKISDDSNEANDAFTDLIRKALPSATDKPN